MEHPNKTTFGDLPPELALNIIDLLNRNSKNNLRAASKNLKNLTDIKLSDTKSAMAFHPLYLSHNIKNFVSKLKYFNSNKNRFNSLINSLSSLFKKDKTIENLMEKSSNPLHATCQSVNDLLTLSKYIINESDIFLQHFITQIQQVRDSLKNETISNKQLANLLDNYATMFKNCYDSLEEESYKLYYYYSRATTNYRINLIARFYLREINQLLCGERCFDSNSEGLSIFILLASSDNIMRLKFDEFVNFHLTKAWSLIPNILNALESNKIDDLKILLTPRSNEDSILNENDLNNYKDLGIIHIRQLYAIQKTIQRMIFNTEDPENLREKYGDLHKKFADELDMRIKENNSIKSNRIN